MTRDAHDAQARGQRLRDLRRQRGLSLARLAAITGYTTACIWNVESGRNSPSCGLLFALSDALGVSVHVIERGVDFGYPAKGWGGR